MKDWKPIGCCICYSRMLPFIHSFRLLFFICLRFRKSQLFLLLLERYSNLCKCYCSVGVSNSTSCHEVVTSSGTFTDVLPPQGKLISEDSGTDSAASAAGVDKIRGTHHSSSIQLRLSSRDICRQEFCARRARRTSVE